MVDLLEIIERFNLDEKPYINLGNVWCRDGHSIYFIEEGCVYSAVQGNVIGEEDGIVCINNDVQQFMGMQPAIFDSSLEFSPEKFEELYGDFM
ncbi:hypothetical protein NVP1063O_178 [Vibrio phage 1.063.O._10N.261.45.C7]|nr:hypothetical protein NVP1063O_178 [Vibrio phage 1.063.O._10N.261.45.C7]